MNKSKISIAEDFSPYPAGRFPDDGKYNAATFRTEVLMPALTDNEYVEVTFDKVVGIGASFLDEAFGGLVRKEGMTKESLGSHLRSTTREAERAAFVTLTQRYTDEAQTEK